MCSADKGAFLPPRSGNRKVRPPERDRTPTHDERACFPASISA
jgi:hypothetical protein